MYDQILAKEKTPHLVQVVVHMSFALLWHLHLHFHAPPLLLNLVLHPATMKLKTFLVLKMGHVSHVHLCMLRKGGK